MAIYLDLSDEKDNLMMAWQNAWWDDEEIYAEPIESDEEPSGLAFGRDPDFSDARGGVPGKPGGDPTSPPPPPPPPGEEPLDSYRSGEADDLAAGVDNYNIDINFVGDDWTVELQEAFIVATEFLSLLIQTGFADDPSVPDTSTNNPTDTVYVDDLLIHAELANLPGNTLGRAGPEYAHDDIDWIPVEGTMEFDTQFAQNNVDSGDWLIVVLHEMLHVLGFGTLWGPEYMDLKTDDGLYFDGPLTTSLFLEESLAIEQDGGAGTAGGHWDEDTYELALMSGYLDSGSELMDFSVAALIDMGYDIDHADIDTYSLGEIETLVADYLGGA